MTKLTNGGSFKAGFTACMLIVVAYTSSAVALPTYQPDTVFTNHVISSTPWLSKPADIAVDASEFVYIVETEKHRVVVVDKHGYHVVTFGAGVNPATPGLGPESCYTFCSDGVPSSQPGGFNFPMGVTIDHTTGYLWVADTGNSRLQVLKLDQFITQYPVPGLIWPRGIHAAENGRVYVTGWFGLLSNVWPMLSVFDSSSGQQIMSIHNRGDGSTFCTPVSVPCNGVGQSGTGIQQFLAPYHVTTRLGKIYVSNGFNVKVFNAQSGAYLNTLGPQTFTPYSFSAGELDMARGIDANLNRLYIADAGNSRATVWKRLNGDHVGSFGYEVNPLLPGTGYEHCYTVCQQGVPGYGPGQFFFDLGGWGAAIDDPGDGVEFSDNSHRLYITDKSRVQRFKEVG